MENPIGTIWGTLVKSSRQSRGITQDELAAEVDVDRKTIMRMESGETQRIGLDVFVRICQALEIRPSDVFAALAPDAEAIPLPPPLPRPLAALVAVYGDMSESDRLDLLERVGWVVEWAEARVAAYSTDHPRRRPRRTG